MPEAIEDGSLDWLRSFESGTADIYYLGDLTDYKKDILIKDTNILLNMDLANAH